MPTKKPNKRKKPSTRRTSPVVGDDTGLALHGLAKEVGDISEGLHKLYHLEQLADNVGDLGQALHALANATAISVIAKYGSEGDRAVALSHLKNWFEDFR